MFQKKNEIGGIYCKVDKRIRHTKIQLEEEEKEEEN
jgi:hypothetical protein